MPCLSPLLAALLLNAAPLPEADAPDPVLAQRAQAAGLTGGALVVVGAGLWVAGEVRLRTFPDDRALTPVESESHRRAQHLATGGFATVMTGAAVLGVAWLVHLESLRPATEGTRAFALTPTAGPGGGGLLLRGRF